MHDVKVAVVSEIARYDDGKTVHCALARGHNNGIDEHGVNHQELFEDRRDKGELPFITKGIQVTPVVGHVRDGVSIPSHWRSKAEDIEKFILGGGEAGGEGEAHRLAKQACLNLIEQGKIRSIIRGELPSGFHLGGQAPEVSIKVDDDIYFADVGAWDARFPDTPVVFEITNTSGQKAKRLKAMSDVGIRVYEIVIGPKVRSAARNGVEINVGFFESMMLKSKFRLRNGVSTDCALTRYIRIKEAEQEALMLSEDIPEPAPPKPATLPQFKTEPVKPKPDVVTPAVQYVRKFGADVSANHMLSKIRSMRGREVHDYYVSEATHAAYVEIKNMSKVRAIHIDHAVDYYARLSAHD